MPPMQATQIESDTTVNQIPAANTSVPLDDLAGPDGGEESNKLTKYWQDQIEKCLNSPRRKRWVKRGRKIVTKYRNERDRGDDESEKRYNALWANTEILTPAIYGRCPVPVAERKFRDKDPVGRGAAQILERALRNEIEICGFDMAMQQAVRDYLLPGLGTVWVRYEPEIEEGVSLPVQNAADINRSREDSPNDQFQNETPGQDKLTDTGDRVVRESTPVDYIHWEDFFTFPSHARTWAETFAVGKRVFLTFDQMKKRFGKAIAKQVPLKRDERREIRGESVEEDQEVKCEVFEIWSKNDKAVFWVSLGYQYLCDRKDDPLNLEFFFPCPRPIMANATTDTMIPVPDYIQYQDQAIQIDELTQRISLLAKACKVVGVYNRAAKTIDRLMSEGVENQLLPVDDWAAFAEKGGIAGNISMLPLKEIIGVLNELVMIKEKTITEMDRLTGITDIMRGTTDARETLGGQRLKTNSSGTRLQRRQNEVGRLARDTVRIMADIMAQHFSDRSLIDASGALFEEGLGQVDSPSIMHMMDGVQQGGPSSGRPAVPGLPGPVIPGSPTPPMPAPGGAPGTNVVPFRPPGPPAQGPMGAPGALPMSQGMPGQAPPQAPQGDDKLMALIAGLKRIEESLKLIRNDKLRGFRVDIEVDSTIYGDSEQEKADRTEFLGAVTKFMEQAMQMGTAMPEAVPLLGKFLQFGVRGYKIGRDLETSIEDFCDEAVVAAKRKAQQAQTQPNPLLIKTMAQAKRDEATGQAALMQGQAAVHRAQSESQSDTMQAQADVQQSQAEVQRQHIENQGELANSQADLAMKQIEMRMKEMEQQIAQLHALVEMHKADAAIETAKYQKESLGEDNKPGA